MIEQHCVWQTPVGESPVKPLEYWTEMVAENLFGVNIDALQSDRFAGRLELRRLGDAGLLRTHVSPQLFHRTSRAIARDGCDDVIVNLMLDGRLRLRQFGREDVASPGDCFLSDCSERFDYHCPDAIQALTLRLPRTVVLRQMPDIEAAMGRKIDGNSPWGRTLRSYIEALAEDGPTEILPAGMLVEQAVSLIRIALGPNPAGPSSHQAAILGRARTVLRQRWDEEGLSPSTVAREIGISRSHIHALFAKAGTTFGRELEAVRLDRAAAMLGPTGRRFTVSEVAYRCGFSSPAHFSRKFRIARGMSPSDYRHQAF